jgi:hypothetical protein
LALRSDEEDDDDSFVLALSLAVSLVSFVSLVLEKKDEDEDDEGAGGGEDDLAVVVDFEDEDEDEGAGGGEEDFFEDLEEAGASASAAAAELVFEAGAGAGGAAAAAGGGVRSSRMSLARFSSCAFKFMATVLMSEGGPLPSFLANIPSLSTNKPWWCLKVGNKRTIFTSTFKPARCSKRLLEGLMHFSKVSAILVCQLLNTARNCLCSAFFESGLKGCTRNPGLASASRCGKEENDVDE